MACDVSPVAMFPIYATLNLAESISHSPTASSSYKHNALTLFPTWSTLDLAENCYRLLLPHGNISSSQQPITHFFLTALFLPHNNQLLTSSSRHSKNKQLQLTAGVHLECWCYYSAPPYQADMKGMKDMKGKSEAKVQRGLRCKGLQGPWQGRRHGEDFSAALSNARCCCVLLEEL